MIKNIISARVETTFIKRKILVFWHLSAMHFNIYEDQFLLINSTKVLFTVTNDDFFLLHPIVHMRLRPINQSIPKTMSPSTSAITYWQIERQEGPVSGKFDITNE